MKKIKLAEKISQAKEVIKKTYFLYNPEKTIVAWTGGKDSTVLLYLIKEALGKIPFPIMFNDSTMEFDEVYSFIKKITKKLSLNLTVVKHLENELEEFGNVKDMERKLELSRMMKIHAVEKFIDANNIETIFVGIRHDEHASRSKETHFSKRKNHTRIHPILEFTEEDIWSYIKAYNVPYVSLYDKGYRSLGEKPFTSKAKKGRGERSGREQNKEILMERLRSLGYW